MDRREFIKFTAGFALLSAGAVTGISRLFADNSTFAENNPANHFFEGI